MVVVYRTIQTMQPYLMWPNNAMNQKSEQRLLAVVINSCATLFLASARYLSLSLSISLSLFLLALSPALFSIFWLQCVQCQYYWHFQYFIFLRCFINFLFICNRTYEVILLAGLPYVVLYCSSYSGSLCCMLFFPLSSNDCAIQ